MYFTSLATGTCRKGEMINWRLGGFPSIWAVKIGLQETSHRIVFGSADLLSFPVSETGDDVGRTGPREANCSAPQLELSVDTVHVASFACQALFVTNEHMTLVRQFIYQLPDRRLCTLPPLSAGSSSQMSPASPRSAQNFACTSAKRLAKLTLMHTAFLASRSRFMSHIVQ